MLKYLVEFIGTFFFLSVILSQGQAIPIAIALAGAIFFGGAISGGHFNPAVSVLMNLAGSLSLKDLVGYIVSQLAGAYLALFFKRLL
jgi:aquaporin Z